MITIHGVSDLALDAAAVLKEAVFSPPKYAYIVSFSISLEVDSFANNSLLRLTSEEKLLSLTQKDAHHANIPLFSRLTGIILALLTLKLFVVCCTDGL